MTFRVGSRDEEDTKAGGYTLRAADSSECRDWIKAIHLALFELPSEGEGDGDGLEGEDAAQHHRLAYRLELLSTREYPFGASEGATRDFLRWRKRQVTAAA